MKKLVLVVPLLYVAPLLQGCSSLPSASEAWHVSPKSYVRHAFRTPDAYYQLARYYQGQHRLEQAEAALKEALALDDSHVEARNALGTVHASQGRLELAIAEFQYAIALAPTAAHVRNNLGYALYLQERYAQAVGVLEEALVLEPDNASTRNNLGLARAKLGMADTSTEAFTADDAHESLLKTKSAVASQLTESGESSIAIATKPQNLASPAKEIGSAFEERPVLPTDRAIRRVREPSTMLPVSPTTNTPVSASGTAAEAGASGASTLELVQLEPMVFELRRKTLATTGLSHVPPAASSDPPLDITRAIPTAVPTTRAFRLEISNGNGVTGMAKRVSHFLVAAGLPAARLTNKTPFRQVETEVYYRDGFEQEALRLTQSLPTRPVPKVWSADSRTDVRVVLGRDVTTRFAAEQADKPALIATYADPDD